MGNRVYSEREILSVARSLGPTALRAALEVLATLADKRLAEAAAK